MSLKASPCGGLGERTLGTTRRSRDPAAWRRVFRSAHAQLQWLNMRLCEIAQLSSAQLSYTSVRPACGPLMNRVRSSRLLATGCGSRESAPCHWRCRPSARGRDGRREAHTGSALNVDWTPLPLVIGERRRKHGVSSAVGWCAGWDRLARCVLFRTSLFQRER